MKHLTAEQIEKLASRAGVKRRAVENFLGTLCADAGKSGNLANCWQDALVYRWNAATVGAIEAGIKLAYKA